MASRSSFEGGRNFVAFSLDRFLIRQSMNPWPFNAVPLSLPALATKIDGVHSKVRLRFHFGYLTCRAWRRAEQLAYGLLCVQRRTTAMAGYDLTLGTTGKADGPKAGVGRDAPMADSADHKRL
jgi:hypothetical protein